MELVANVAGRPNKRYEVIDKDGTFTDFWYRFMEQMWVRSGGASDGISESAPVGEIKAFGGAEAPDKYLLCDGSEVSRVGFSDLFSVIGNLYGNGDGVNTFNLPDGRGRTLVGAGSGPGLTARVRGEEFGEEEHTLTLDELTVHNHGITDSGHAHDITDPEHNHGVTDSGHEHDNSTDNFVNDAAGTEYDNTNGDKGTTNSATASATTGITIDNASTGVTVDSAVTGITVDDEGSGNAFNVIQPSFVANYIIRAT